MICLSVSERNDFSLISIVFLSCVFVNLPIYLKKKRPKETVSGFLEGCDQNLRFCAFPSKIVIRSKRALRTISWSVGRKWMP